METRLKYGPYGESRLDKAHPAQTSDTLRLSEKTFDTKPRCHSKALRHAKVPASLTASTTARSVAGCAWRRDGFASVSLQSRTSSLPFICISAATRDRPRRSLRSFLSASCFNDVGYAQVAAHSFLCARRPLFLPLRACALCGDCQWSAAYSRHKHHQCPCSQFVRRVVS